MDQDSVENAPRGLADWALRQPGHPAVVDGDSTTTYAMLNEQADRVAEALAASLAAGSGGRLVGVRTGIRREWFVVNLALAKLGWTHVALNRQLSIRELSDIVRDSRVATVFLDDEEPAEAVAVLASQGVMVVTVAGRTPGAVPLSALLEAPAVPRSNDRPAALVTYSSGTTGKPRGVSKPRPRDAEEARRLREYLTEAASVQRGRHAERTLLTLPLHHGAGPNSALTGLGAGGTVYLIERYDPVRALETIHRERITRWTVVPTMLARIRALPEDVLAAYDVSSLRRLGVGGAPVPYPLKVWAMSYFRDDCLVERYGAAEVGMVTLMPPGMHKEKPGSCGKLRRHVEVRVVDADGVPVPRGTEGELLIRTPLTVSGYLHGSRDSGLVTPEGFFRIGDAGRLDEDDYLYITGRIKDMIVTGGANVYPAEVEQVLTEHQDVVDAAVVGYPDDDMGERVAAFCELRTGATVTAEELSVFAAARLAPYKRPRRMTFVDGLPRNSMGKVLKTALRASARELGSQSVAG